MSEIFFNQFRFDQNVKEIKVAATQISVAHFGMDLTEMNSRALESFEDLLEDFVDLQSKWSTTLLRDADRVSNAAQLLSRADSSSKKVFGD